MRKENLKLTNMKKMASMINQEVEVIYATTNGEERMTVTLNIWKTGAQVYLNISDVVTYFFQNENEFNEYINKKFTVYNSDKEMWQAHTGMDDETWEEWNK